MAGENPLTAWIDQAYDTLGFNTSQTRPVTGGNPVEIEGTGLAPDESGGIWGWLDKQVGNVGNAAGEYLQALMTNKINELTHGPESRPDTTGSPADQVATQPARPTQSSGFDLGKYQTPLLITAGVLLAVLVIKRL